MAAGAGGIGKDGTTESGASVRAGANVGVRGGESKLEGSSAIHGTADDGTPCGIGNEYDVGPGGPRYGYNEYEYGYGYAYGYGSGFGSSL